MDILLIILISYMQIHWVCFKHLMVVIVIVFPFWNLMIILLDLESKGLHLPIQKFILYLKLHILVQKMFLCIVIIFLQNIQKKMVVM